MVEQDDIKQRIGQIRADLYDIKEQLRDLHHRRRDLRMKALLLRTEEEDLNKMLAQPSNRQNSNGASQDEMVSRSPEK